MLKGCLSSIWNSYSLHRVSARRKDCPQQYYHESLWFQSPDFAKEKSLYTPESQLIRGGKEDVLQIQVLLVKALLKWTDVFSTLNTIKWHVDVTKWYYKDR